VACLVYLATPGSSKVAGDLTRAVYRVFEAQAVSHVLSLCETEKVDAVLIAPDVEDPGCCRSADTLLHDQVEAGSDGQRTDLGAVAFVSG